jgi:hypothetical protein
VELFVSSRSQELTNISTIASYSTSGNMFLWLKYLLHFWTDRAGIEATGNATS